VIPNWPILKRLFRCGRSEGLTLRWNRRYAPPGREAPRLMLRFAARRRTARLNFDVRALHFARSHGRGSDSFGEAERRLAWRRAVLLGSRSHRSWSWLGAIGEGVFGSQLSRVLSRLGLPIRSRARSCSRAKGAAPAGAKPQHGRCVSADPERARGSERMAEIERQESGAERLFGYR